MQNGSQEPQRDEIVSVGGSDPKRVRPQVVHGTFMLVLGALLSQVFPFVGVVLIAYGMRELVEAKGVLGVGLAAAEAAVLVAMTAFANTGSALLMVSTMVASIGVVACMWHGATVTNVTVAIVAAALASLGIDAAIAAFSGTSVRDIAVSYFMDTVRQTIGDDAQGTLLTQQIEPIVDAIWPFSYVASSATDALMVGIGSHLMAVRSSGSARHASLERFDAPMWSVAVLAISVVCLSASFTGFPEAGVLRTISATALMSVRIIFAAQGLGVISAFMNRHRWGCALRVIALCFLFWIEMVLFLMSIIGLVDIWANFRKLARDGSDRQEQH